MEQKILREFQEKVSRLFEEMEYRPVVVAILKTENGEVLLTQSAKNHDYWGFPQGGINKGENIVDALLREVEEETGISSLFIDVQGIVHEDGLDINRMNRDGFTKGKHYFYFLITCAKRLQVKLAPDELSDHRWVKPNDARQLLAHVEPNKRRSLLAALERT